MFYLVSFNTNQCVSTWCHSESLILQLWDLSLVVQLDLKSNLFKIITTQGNVFTPVCHSVHGRGCLPLVRGGVLPHTPQADTACLGRHSPGKTHLPWADTPLSRHPTPRPDTPLRSACWDTVNKWGVHIPLACILVQLYFSV